MEIQMNVLRASRAIPLNALNPNCLCVALFIYTFFSCYYFFLIL